MEKKRERDLVVNIASDVARVNRCQYLLQETSSLQRFAPTTAHSLLVFLCGSVPLW